MEPVIENYLSLLKERNELDLLLRNLLMSNGFEVIKRAFQGEKELGVDIAAIKVESNQPHLYLFQVKAGDLNRSQWDNGANSVRSSLNEAIDAPFSAFARLHAPPAKKHLVVVFNGDLRNDCQEQFDGFVQQAMARHSDITITYWNLAKLVQLVKESLFNHGLLLAAHQDLLKKVLAFADVPEYSFAEYKELLKQITNFKPRNQKDLKRMLNTVRLVTRMVVEYAQRGDSYKNGVVASEVALLMLSQWTQENLDQIKPKNAKGLFLEVLLDYQRDLSCLIARLRPSLEVEHGLFMGDLSEKVEYPLRVFEILGLLAMHALVSIHLGEWTAAEETTNLLVETINNNPAAHRPLLDNHGIDITLVALAFLFIGRPEEAASYAEAILSTLAHRLRLGKPLPELYNRIDLVIEALAYKRPLEYNDSSSTLIPILLELLLLKGDSDDFGPFAGVFKQTNLQTWYPPKDYSREVFSRELVSGLMETNIPLPQSATAFRGKLKERYQRFQSDQITDMFSSQVCGMSLFIAFRHFRTPVFPSLWREWIFPELIQT